MQQHAQRVLIVLMRDFSIGGSLTSLLNFLELLKQEKHIEIDLLMLNYDGILYDTNRIYARLLKENMWLRSVYVQPSLLKRKGHYLDFIRRGLFVAAKKVLGMDRAMTILYQRQARRYTGYDVCIAFQEGRSTTFAQYVPTCKRIAWLHNEYQWIVGNESEAAMEKKYLCFDHIVGVSDTVTQSFAAYHPTLSTRCITVYNPMNVDGIKGKSYEAVQEMSLHSGTIFISVGRFAKQKQFQRVPEVAARLLQDGLAFHWYIIGAGQEFDQVKARCETMGVQAHVHLLGQQGNPYAYMAKADCQVITSLYEAHPMVANEALILHKPVITTNYPSAKEVVKHGKNGLICENSVDGLYQAMATFLQDVVLRKKLMENALCFEYSNAKIAAQFMALLKEKEE